MATNFQAIPRANYKQPGDPRAILIQDQIRKAVDLINLAYINFEDLEGGTTVRTDRLELHIQDFTDHLERISLYLENFPSPQK